jgi:hypothetical protein
MSRPVFGKETNAPVLKAVGLSPKILRESLAHTYDILDRIDSTLTSAGGFPLSQTVELANLSAMIGNIFGAALALHSNKFFRRNGPHKYPDLLSTEPLKRPDLEIKMALEGNKPKGHLAKPGQYITCRYVLCTPEGVFTLGKQARGVTPYLWEIRCGLLAEHHFSISNTAGDSGKTAVVNAEGMEALKIVYIDIERAPFPKKGRPYAEYAEFVASTD